MHSKMCRRLDQLEQRRRPVAVLDAHDLTDAQLLAIVNAALGRPAQTPVTDAELARMAGGKA